MIWRSLVLAIATGLAACQISSLTADGDCPAAIEAQTAATAEQNQIADQFAREWRAGCEASYSAEACGSDGATQDMVVQRDALLKRWWLENGAPRIAEATRQCAGGGKA